MKLKVLSIEASRSKAYKYVAILEENCGDKIKKKRVNFGRRKSKHYVDKTKLKIYSCEDTKEKKIREKFKSKYLERSKVKYSRFYFEKKYLY